MPTRLVILLNKVSIFQLQYQITANQLCLLVIIIVNWIFILAFYVVVLVQQLKLTIRLHIYPLNIHFLNDTNINGTRLVEAMTQRSIQNTHLKYRVLMYDCSVTQGEGMKTVLVKKCCSGPPGLIHFWMQAPSKNRLKPGGRSPGIILPPLQIDQPPLLASHPPSLAGWLTLPSNFSLLRRTLPPVYKLASLSSLTYMVTSSPQLSPSSSYLAPSTNWLASPPLRRWLAHPLCLHYFSPSTL